MPIRAVCPNAGCGKTLTVGDQFAGRKGKCPACGTMVDIPGTKPLTDSSGSMPRSRPAAVTRMARPIEEEAEWEVIEDEPPPPPPPKSKVIQAVPIPAPPPRPARPVEPEIVSADEVEVVDSTPVKSGVPVSAEPPRRRDENDRDDDRRRRRDDDDERDRRDRRRDEDDDRDYDRPRRRRDDDDDEDDRDRSRRNDDEQEKDFEWKPKWHLVRIGMLITFIGMCAITGGLAIEAIAHIIMLIGAAGTSGGAMETAGVFFQIAVIFTLIAAIPMMAGTVFGIFSSNKYGAIGLAIACVAVSLADAVLQIIFRVMPAFDSVFDALAVFGQYATTGKTIGTLFTDATFAAVPILYSLYLRAVYNTAKDRERGNACLMLTYAFGAYFGLRLVVFILVLIARNSMSQALGYIIFIAMILAAGAMAGAYGWQLSNLWQARRTVRFRLIKKAGTRD